MAGVGTTMAGGLERGGYSIDLLFDQSPFVGEIGLAYIMPQRELDDVVDVDARGIFPAAMAT
jgi:long-chain fatty acid transport protein